MFGRYDIGITLCCSKPNTRFRIVRPSLALLAHLLEAVADTKVHQDAADLAVVAADLEAVSTQLLAVVAKSTSPTYAANPPFLFL